MTAWLFIAILIGVCLTVLIYLKRNKEPFVTFQDMQQAGNSFVNQMGFANKMGKYAADTVAKGIFTNPGVNLSGLNDAAKQPDMYLATTRDRDYTSFFTPDPENAYSEHDKTFCKGAMYPLDLPARQKFSRVACGWWFHPTEQSVGVLGTVDGPIFSQGLPAGGSFYWNLEDAALKEDFKKCKVITDCEMIDIPSVKGKCAWCDSLGHAIPINSDGSEKYPDAVDEDTCGEELINLSGNCPKPDPEAPETENGISCGNYGKPSADNNIRVYTQGECTDKFGGNWFSNGECLNPMGGSYSWDCRGLNKPRSIQPQLVTACTPDARGNLSRACLIQTATSLGFGKQGSIYKMLYTTNGPSENDKLAMKYLEAAGLTIPTAVLGAGNIDRMSAANIYSQIYNTITRGKTELVRQSAKLLAVGTTEFDPCTVDGKQTGPFDVTCAQRAFRQAGCQPAGTAYPSASSVTELASMTWDQVNASFQKLHSATGSGSPEAQDKAMQQCLGIKYTRPPPLPCTNPGMEHIMYSFAGGDWNNVDGIWYLACVGTLRNPTGFREINVGGGVVPETGGRTDNVQMKVRSIVNGATGITGQLDCWTDDGLKVWVGNNLVLNAWYDQAPTYHGAGVNFPAGKNTVFEVNWYERGGGATLIMRNAIEAINRSAYLPYHKDSPIVAFDFFRGRLDDCHQVLRSRNVGGVTLDSRGGRQGAYIGNNQYIQILTPIRMRAFKTFTCMVWHDNPHATSRLWSWHTKDDWYGTSISTSTNANSVGAAYFRFPPYGIGTGASTPNMRGRWMHIAVTWSDMGYGMKIFIDGVAKAQSDNADLYADIGGSWMHFPDDIFKFGFIGGFAAINGNRAATADNGQYVMAWYHMYDYKLTQQQIADEMKYWDDNNNTGPIYDFPSYPQTQYVY